MNIAELVNLLNKVAPPRLKEDYDNVGLLVGSFQQEITGVLTALELSDAVIDEALQLGYNTIVTHHPIIFRPLKKLNHQTYNERMIYRCIKHDLAVFTLHTNFDNISQGVNHFLAKKFDLIDTQPLRKLSAYYKVLVVYVPSTHISTLRTALAHAGAGEIGNYTECSFSSAGLGTFIPNAQANPVIGTQHELTQTPEMRLEMRFPATLESTILKTLHQHHPYETPAYHIFKDDAQNSLLEGAGIIGKLPRPYTISAFLILTKEMLKHPALRYTKTNKTEVETIALCGGAGSFLLSDAIQKNADVYITGDITYHTYFDVPQSLMLIDGGHYETEQFVAQGILEIISKSFPNLHAQSTQHCTNPINYF